MMAIVGGIAGGIGLFFMGARLLSEHLKSLANRRLRMSASRWTGSRWSGCAWGTIAGAITQSMPALTFISIGMLRSGLLTCRRALPILLGGNVGSVLILFVVMLDIRLAVLYVLGVAQIVAVMTAKGRTARVRLQTMGGALFAMGIMVLGFIMLKDSVAPLAGYAWFTHAVQWAARSLPLCLVVGLVLSVLVQSSGVVTVSGVSMAAVGILGVDHVILLHAGACLGSSLSLYLFSMSLKGRSRQVAMYQVLHNCLLSAVFVPIVLVEAYLGVPLLKAAMLATNLPLAPLLGLYLIFSEVTTGAIQLVVLDHAERLLERWWPTTDVERLSLPQYVHDRVLEDADSALTLADREQRRLLEILSSCLDTVRTDAALDPLREAAKDVLNRIEEFLDDVAARYPDCSIDGHVSLLTRQRLLFWLDERVLKLCELLHDMPRGPALDAWRMGMVEGVDAVLLILGEIVSMEDDSDWSSTIQVMNDRGELMRRMRSTYLGGESSLSGEERTSVLRITSITEHVFLLLTKLAHEYQAATTADASEPMMERVSTATA